MDCSETPCQRCVKGFIRLQRRQRRESQLYHLYYGAGAFWEKKAFRGPHRDMQSAERESHRGAPKPGQV